MSTHMLVSLILTWLFPWKTSAQGRLHFPTPREGFEQFPPTFAHSVWGQAGTYPMNWTFYEGCGHSDVDADAGDVPPENVLVAGYKARIRWWVETPYPVPDSERERVRLSVKQINNNTENWWTHNLYFNERGGESSDVSGSWKVNNATLYPGKKGLVDVIVNLPQDFTCSKCILQWVWDSQTAGQGWVQCATISIVQAAVPDVPPKNFTPTHVDSIRPYTAVLNSTCNDTKYCKISSDWEPYKERAAWALINLLRVEPERYESDFMTAFNHGKPICSPGNNRQNLQTSRPPFRYDSDLHHSARYHVWDFVTNNHLGPDTSQLYCNDFVPFMRNDGACSFRSRIRAFNNNDTDDRYTCSTMDGGEQDGSIMPHEQVNDWADECAQLYSSCQTMGLAFLPATPVGGVPLFDNYWAAELGAQDHSRRPLTTSALEGGGSHIPWTRSLVRFFATYRFPTLPVSAELYIGQTGHAMRRWGGLKEGLFSEPVITGWVVDLESSAWAECQPYYFRFVSQQHTFRFPEVGAFLTYGIKDCSEDYEPDHHTHEEPMYALFNFTVYGWDPLATINPDRIRWFLEREWEQNKAPQRIRLYILESKKSSDQKAMWMLLYAYDEQSDWWIGGDEWVQLLDSGSRSERLERMQLKRDGGYQADFIVAAAPFSGVQILEQDSFLADNVHLIAGGIGIGSFLLCCVALVFLGRERCGQKSWSHWKEKMEWTSMLALASVATLLHWVLLLIPYTAGNVWAQSKRLSAEVGSLDKTATICISTLRRDPCDPLTVFSESGHGLLLAVKIIGALGLVLGFFAWFIPAVLTLLRSCYSVADCYPFSSSVLLGGNAISVICSFLVSMLWLVYFNQVLRPIEDGGFTLGWAFYLVCVAWLIGLPSWYLAAGVYISAPEVEGGGAIGLSIANISTAGKRENVQVHTRRIERARQGDWEKIFDEGQNAFYFFNHKTNVSQWNTPNGWKSVK
eukprot:g48827.t1